MPPSSIPSDPDDLLATVRQTLAAYHMLTAGDRVLVGVSGGPDSMVLLHLLNRLAPTMKISLGVAHLNHCLRGVSADQDAEAVQRAATRLGLPCHMGKANVTRVKQRLKLSLEEAARRVRYAFFHKIINQANYDKLALGHHLDDNAEQVLMALLRGAGPRGLAGIAPIHQNRLVRPLIHLRRTQIEAYARQEGITWVDDASNQDLRFMRNRVRHRLLPLLASDYNPSIKKQLSQLADVMRTEEDWIDELITTPYEKTILEREECCLTLCVSTLSLMHPALARRVFRRALLDLTGTLRRIGFAHIQTVMHLFIVGGDGKMVHLPRGIRVSRNGDRLEIAVVKDYRRRAAREVAANGSALQTVVSPPFPTTVKLNSMGSGMTFFPRRPDQLPLWPEIGPHQAFFDLDRLSPPLILRPAIPGDRFIPLGAAGFQKVKKFFIDHHVSRKNRAMTPVLADQRHIIWLVGQRIDNRVKVTPTTTRILGAEFFLLDTR
jgi:tRNA(Ile)-lysidine synthase